MLHHISFNKHKSTNVDDKLIEIISEADSMNSLRSERNIVHQSSKSLHQSLSVVGICLRLYQCVHQLLVSVLEQANEDIEGGRAVRDELTVDVLRQDEVK